MTNYFTIPPGYVLSAICVGVYAWSRFNTPATWRSTTTKWQYNLALLGYMAAAVGIWWLLTNVIKTNPSTIAFITFGSDIPKLEIIKGLSAAFAAALFLTVLLPNIPLLNRIDAAIQNIFRELGAIPRKARQLSAALRRASFAVPEDVREEVRQKLREQGLEPERLMAAEAQSEAWRWVRMVTLMVKLEEAVDNSAVPQHEESDSTPTHARSTFVKHRLVEYEQVCASYRRLATLAGIVFDDDAASQASARGADRLEALRRTFHVESKALFRDLSHLISYGMLSTHFSMRNAREALRSWGFTAIDDPGIKLIGWNDLVGFALAVSCYMFALFMFVRPNDIERALLFSVLIGLTMTIAALCAGLPKKILRTSGTAPRDGLTFGLYLLSGLLAALGWFGIHYMRLMLTQGESLTEVLDGFAVIYPIALIPATAAFLIALVTDLELPRLRLPYWVVRILEGFIHAGALAAAAYVAARMSANLYAQLPADVQAVRRAPPPTELIVPIQVGLGFIIGTLVPHLYRTAAERAVSEERLETDEEIADRSIPPPGGVLAGAD